MSQPSPSDPAALAEELEAIRRRVLNVIGHELRTPVTTLHGLAEQACNATDLETVTATIGPALLRGAERLTTLLDDLLVAAGIQTAIPVGAPEPVELLDLVRRTWAELSPDPLEISHQEVVVSAPPLPLRRAVEAVLDNAAAYGTAPPVVDISSDDTDAVLAVRSPGPSLHPEEVRLATEPFFRGERAVTTRPGLGVGLAVASAMVSHLGGTLVFLDSGDGALTTITLPLEHSS